MRQINRDDSIIDNIRKAENRTKLQLGGLVLKSRLAEYLDIEPGHDLQLDPIYKPKATLLLGALLKVLLEAKLEPSNKMHWKNLGLKALADDIKKKAQV